MLNTIQAPVHGCRVRRWLPLLALACWALASSALAAPAVLRVLAWPGYADPDLVAVFEKRHGVRVEVTTVGSDDILRSKLTDLKGPVYDVVAANTVEISQFVAQQQLVPLSLGDIPNVTANCRVSGSSMRLRALPTRGGCTPCPTPIRKWA